MIHLLNTKKTISGILDINLNTLEEKYNYVKSKTKKKYVKLLKNKDLIEQTDNIDSLCELINIIGYSKTISVANIYRCESININRIISQNKDQLSIKKEILVSIYKSGLIYILCLQIFCPLFIFINSLENFNTYVFYSGSLIQKFSSFFLSQCFLFSINIEIIKEYRESYFFLHSNFCNKFIILLGMSSNLICALLSIICMPFIIITSDGLIDVVFNTMAILFLNELDEALIEEKNNIEYQKILTRYKIDLINKNDLNNIFEKYLYKFNYYLYLFTLIFSKVSILILPFIILFLI